jgi:hypothetical protein
MNLHKLSSLADYFYCLAALSYENKRFAIVEVFRKINPIVKEKEIEDWYNQNSYFLEKFDAYINTVDVISDNVLKIITDNDMIWIISKTPIDLDSDLLKDTDADEFITASVGNIPKLYFYIGKTDNKLIYEPKLSHYYFIIDALNFINSTSSVKYFINKNLDKIKEYIFNNKDKIDKIRSTFSYEPKRLGSGVDGVAFDINEYSVLKIFKSKFAYDQAKKAMDRLHKNPELAKTEAMIYDMGELGTYNDDEIYYYIIEKMIPVEKPNEQISREAKNSINNINNYIKRYLYEEGFVSNELPQLKKLIKDRKNNKEIMAVVNVIVGETVNAVIEGFPKQIDLLNLELNKDWLKLFVEELIIKYITNRIDLHLGNLGVTNNGYLRFFDPAYLGNSSDYSSGKTTE